MHRHAVSLDGDWHYIVDPHDVSSGSQNSRRSYANPKPATGGVVEYDYAKSPTLHVPGDWNLRIPELNISKEVSTDSSGFARIAFDVRGLQLWNPENPKLYQVELRAGEDHLSDEIGFRSIEVRGTDIS